jgi:hypothetical protein
MNGIWQIIFGLSLLALSAVPTAASAQQTAQDQTVSDFLATCTGNITVQPHVVVPDCPKYVMIVDALDTKNFCSPMRSSRTNDQAMQIMTSETQAVVSWLKSHPETQPMEKTAGISRALETLYPCR